MAKKAETDVGKIGHSMVISGSVEAGGPVVLEGKIDGAFSGTTLYIEKSGQLKGEASTSSIECAGQIEGTIVTRYLKLESSARHIGTVETEKLEVEPGAVLDCALQSGSSKISGRLPETKGPSPEPPPGAPPEATPETSSKTPPKSPQQIHLEAFLTCFDEENRPCCYDVPWSRRMELYSQLVEVLDKRKPLVKVLGGRGAGKSVLVAKLLKDLPAWYIPLQLDCQVGSVADILAAVAVAMGATREEAEKPQPELLDVIRGYAGDKLQSGKRFVLLLDDAHLMYQATLEGVVRLLSGASEAEYSGAIKENRLQILLFGTSELEKKMVATIVEYFEDETNCQFFLEPLNINDTAAYIRLSLQLVAKGDTHAVVSIFPQETIQKIHDMSKGDIAETIRLAQKGLRVAHSSGQSVVAPRCL